MIQWANQSCRALKLFQISILLHRCRYFKQWVIVTGNMYNLFSTSKARKSSRATSSWVQIGNNNRTAMSKYLKLKAEYKVVFEESVWFPFSKSQTQQSITSQENEFSSALPRRWLPIRTWSAKAKKDVPSAESSRSVRGLRKGVNGKPYHRLCNARRSRLEPGTFLSQAARLYRCTSPPFCKSQIEKKKRGNCKASISFGC